MDRPLEVVILGGGTAGWTAAAGLASLLPPGRCRIRLIESEEIGIVGVGEATLPHMKSFNDAIGLDEAEMMRRTHATFKLGIEFVDWGFKGSSYIHPFGIHGPANQGLAFHHRWLRALQSGWTSDIEEFSFAVMAARDSRFDFPPDDKTRINSTYSYAYQLDANLYAPYLREFSEARGVVRTEGKVESVNLDPESGDAEVLGCRLELDGLHRARSDVQPDHALLLAKHRYLGSPDGVNPVVCAPGRHPGGGLTLRPSPLSAVPIRYIT